MESIEQMIKRLCPKGVEYVKLGEVCEIMRGKRLTKKELFEDAKFKVFHGGLSPIGYYTKSNRQAQTVMIINVGASAGTVGFCEEDFWSSDGCFCLSHNDSVIHPKYLYYYLAKHQISIQSRVRKAGIPTLDAGAVMDILIPVPPLELQSRIVEVLDKMTTLTAKLEAELEAELEARKQQYEYYRNKLLTFSEIGEGNRQVTWKKISEIAVLKAGKAIKASELSDIRDSQHQYPCYGGNGIRGYIAKYSHEGRYAIIGRQGALCGCVNWVEGKFYATEHAVVCTPKTLSDSRFLYFLFKNENLNRYKSQGAQPGLSVANLYNIMLPIPPLSEQQRIVSILDRFEALTTDLQSGLPAEIEARRQQYEYYRNKLLTFEAV